MFIPLHDQNKLTSINLQYVTLILIAVNIIVFFVSGTAFSPESEFVSSVYYSYGFVPAVVNDYAQLPVEFVVLPDEASYLSYAFFHVGYMHLLGNMLFIWVFGDNIEDAMGHLRFLAFYLMCAIAGALLHSLTFPASEAPLIGASGAAAGIIGAYLVLHPNVKVWVLAFGRIPLRLTAFWVLGAWIAFQLFYYFATDDNEVSFAAHLGGFFAGAVLIVFMRKKGVPLWDKDMNKKETEVTANPEAETEAKSKSPEDLSPHKWGRPDQ